jgi:molybdopterin synthase catalytic subunit
MKTLIKFVHAPIAPPPAELPNFETGARLEFLGIVRALEAGRAIPGLFYEAHEPMAQRQLERIFQELTARNPCSEILFIHRLDFVPVGEASLFIRVSSSHRRSALLVMDELINRLKADVPVWKRASGS